MVGGPHPDTGNRGGPGPVSRSGPGPAAGTQLKFDGEFDFEQSNAQFDKEQIEKELKEKLTIGNCHLLVSFLWTRSSY